MDSIIVVSNKGMKLDNNFKKKEIAIKEYVPNKLLPEWKLKGRYMVYSSKRKDKNSKENKNTESKEKQKTQEQQILPEYRVINQINSNLCNWKCIALFKSILKETVEMEGEQQIYIKKDSSFEYFGKNPVGNLIINYFSLNLINNKRKKKLKLKQFNEVKLINLRVINRSNLNVKWFESECIDAYFDYFNPYFPVVDEIAFRNKPNELLKKVVIGMGYKYIPNLKYDNEILQQLDSKLIDLFLNSYFKPSISLVQSLVLITNFQVLLSLIDKFWYFQNSSIKLSIMLGLNKNIPKSLNLNKRMIRYRYHLWWGSCIHDKYYSLALNRPTSIQPEDWYLPYPKIINLNRLPDIPTSIQKKEIREIASGMYWRWMALLTEIIGYIKIYRNKRESEDVDLLQKELDWILKKVEKSINYFKNIMQRIYSNQPKWVYNICIIFVLYIIKFSNSLIIEVINLYIKLPLARKVSYYEKIAINSAIQILNATGELGEVFCKYGVPFRFISLGNAILVLATKLCSENSKDLAYSEKELKTLIEKGLEYLNNASPYNPIVKEVMKVITDLIELPDS
ncbi:hypothetical protein K502DRAFT_324601 [Neoconidiobolus thromboides FSU 785]|nr:hypothetical protein K502DRAFT_324601 [Neoconidiobolus thromboides FSU 785]